MAHREEAPSPSLLILAQVDHACGDVIASVIDQLASAGAMNVHLVPSLTKKGRPGYLLHVDVPPESLPAVERILAVELGILGWRILPGEHRGPSFEDTTIDVPVCARVPNLTRKVPVKLVTDPLSGSQVGHIEHDFCVRLQQELRDSFGVLMPLRVLKAHLQAAIADSLEDISTCNYGRTKENQS